MKRYLFETSEIPKITIEKIMGSLRIKGWYQNTFLIDTDLPDSLEIDQHENSFTVNSKSDCLFRVPLKSEIIIEDIAGDLVVKSLDNSLTIENVDGQIILKSVGSTLIEKVNGNLSLKQIEGNLNIESAFGNVVIRDIDGDLILEDGKGDFNFSGTSQNMDINTMGNANITLEPEYDGNYNINVKGDMIFRLDSTINANVKFISHAKTIHINTREQKEEIAQKEYEIISDQDNCIILLEAKGSIRFFEDQLQDHLEDSLNFNHLDLLGGLEGNLTSLADNITQQVTENLNMSISSFTDQISNITSNIGDNKSTIANANKDLKLKRRKLQEMAKNQREVAHGARKTALRARKLGRKKKILKYQTYHKDKKNTDPVSDQERQKILQMLQDKKININQAEILLAALEGQKISAPQSPPPPPKAPSVPDLHNPPGPSDIPNLDEMPNLPEDLENKDK